MRSTRTEFYTGAPHQAHCHPAQCTRAETTSSLVRASENTLLLDIINGPITTAILARFGYEMRMIRARFEHDATSYEELCAFEQ